MKFMIRQASTTDAPTLAHMELATKLSCYGFLTEQQRAAMTPRGWREWLLNEPPFHHPQSFRRCFLAYDWNNIFGFAAVRHQSNYAGFAADLSGLFVVPRNQRQGVGRALLVAAARWLAVDEIYTMTVDCYAAGPGGGFLERMGGRVIDRWSATDGPEDYITFGFNNLREIVRNAES